MARYAKFALFDRETGLNKPWRIDLLKRYTTRNARRDGSRPSASRDSHRVAPAAVAPYWPAAPHHADLPLDRANRCAISPVVRRRPRVHPRRTARGSQSVNQSLSRPAARHEVGSAIVHGVYRRKVYYLHPRARADYHTRGERLSSSRLVRARFLPGFSPSWHQILSSALMLAIGTDGSANPSGRTQSRVPSRRVWRRVKVTSSSPSSLSASLVRMSWPSWEIAYSPSRGVSSLPARSVCDTDEVISIAARGTMCVTATPLSATKILKDSASRQPARTTIATSAQVQGLSGGNNHNGNNHHHRNAGEANRPQQHTSIM